MKLRKAANIYSWEATWTMFGIFTLKIISQFLE